MNFVAILAAVDLSPTVVENGYLFVVVFGKPVPHLVQNDCLDLVVGSSPPPVVANCCCVVVAETFDAGVAFLSPVFDYLLPFGVAVYMGFAHSKAAIDKVVGVVAHLFDGIQHVFDFEANSIDVGYLLIAVVANLGVVVVYEVVSGYVEQMTPGHILDVDAVVHVSVAAG